jgi:hypothetical protein
MLGDVCGDCLDMLGQLQRLSSRREPAVPPAMSVGGQRSPSLPYSELPGELPADHQKHHQRGEREGHCLGSAVVMRRR